MVKFSKRLTKLRKAKDITQEQLAELVGISRSAVSLYEIDKREPDFDTLKTLAKFFDCSSDFLLGLTDIKKAHIDDAAANRIPPDLSPETYAIIQAEGMQYRYLILQIMTLFPCFYPNIAESILRPLFCPMLSLPPLLVYSPSSCPALGRK